ncbi:MAG: rplI [Gammaproteobacteria bacterium]|nr:rplI [Gammaproteobacteria bacterium]
MEVILLEKIHKLGELGQQVRVKPGYGRNYLIPNGKAIPATDANIARFESRRVELEKAQQDVQSRASARAAAMANLTVTIARRAASEGKLYGSVGTVDIAEAVTATGNELHKHEVRLPEGPFRVLGEHKVDLQLHADVVVTITVNIVAEEETPGA